MLISKPPLIERSSKQLLFAVIIVSDSFNDFDTYFEA